MQYSLGLKRLIGVLNKYINKLDTCIELIKIPVHAFSLIWYIFYDMRDSGSTAAFVEFEGLPNSTLSKNLKRFPDVCITWAALVV